VSGVRIKKVAVRTEKYIEYLLDHTTSGSNLIAMYTLSLFAMFEVTDIQQDDRALFPDIGYNQWK
jgi:hypothetical protein